MTVGYQQLKLCKMPQDSEKRGPIEKTASGWPINPVGVVALLIFAVVVILFIVRPFLNQKTTDQNVQQNSTGGRINSPQVGEIIKSDTVAIDLYVDKPQDVAKVQFWAKSYADNKWEVIGETSSSPYKLDWNVPTSYQNKAVALTTHIYTKDGNIIKDPGGWREGIILLNAER